ncbi:MAG: Re/Si-specific NAD(P)(+) transhydrogenase subunit alpha [Tepidisphaeraceae bacterium]|jgi:NAD(P) transhydrogenase subunit alpha
MKIFVPNEISRGETRVALVPGTVKRLGIPGVEILVESNAGAASSYGDEAYRAAGAAIVGAEGWANADVVLVVGVPAEENIGQLRGGVILAGLLAPHKNLGLIKAMAQRGVSALALEYLPRITRAQGMDVLSSQANLAGYKAVILAAEQSPRIFPMLMTAAGTLRAAKVLVIGAGVAGLQAIATARRLGAIVSAYDVRPAVKEQVMSLGAKFVELPLETVGAQDAGGYAKELSPEQQQKQRELMAQVVAESDVVITTAAVPGKPAPKLISDEVLGRMQMGAVIVDLAADSGGNCQSTEPGKIIRKGDVTLIGLTNVAGTVPFHASQVYANNLLNLMKLILTAEGAAKLDPADEIIAGILLCQGGQIVHPRLKELAHA